MRGPTFTDMRHYFDEGEIPPELPPAAGRMYRYYRDIIEGVVYEPEGVVVPTGVGCRRRPGRKPCRGVIVAVWEFEDEIQVTWECPECGDSGFINGISVVPINEADEIVIEFVDEDEFEEIESPAPTDGGASGQEPSFTPQARRIWESLDTTKQVLVLNTVYCGHCPRLVSMQLQSGRVEKGDLILQGQCLECGGAVARVVEMG